MARPLSKLARIDVPPPPFDRCSHCVYADCGAYRYCRLHRDREPRRYAMTRGDLAERAIGWLCLGFVAGWLSAWKATEWFLRQ